MKNKPFHIKLKAGALQYTIFIAVVIALLVFAFMSLSFTQQQFKLKADNFSAVVHNSNLAMRHAEQVEIKYNEIVTLQFSENELEQTTVQKTPWGVFDVVIATSSLKNETFAKNALLGGFLSDRTALYLQDDNQPLVVVGTTKIEGKVLLPKQGVKRGTIAGNSYTGAQLIYGNVGLSESSLPTLTNAGYLKQLCWGQQQFNTTVPLGLEENITIVNSFKEPVQLFSSTGSIDLRAMRLTGNIIIKSNSSISVHASTVLTDVILIAPKIKVFDGVKGNFQAFASKEISIGKSCELAYPSAFVVYEKKVVSGLTQNNRNKEFNKIQIESGSEIKGVVGFLSENESNNYKPQILLEENAFVNGEVYCNGNLELKGTVSGSVFTKGFIANQFGSIYQNHIYNGQIFSADFPKQYSGLAIENGTKSIVKWLY